MWIVNVLMSEDVSDQVRIGEAFSVAIMSLLSDDINVALAASSCLRTIVKLIPSLIQFNRELVETIVTAISVITTKLMVGSDQTLNGRKNYPVF